MVGLVVEVRKVVTPEELCCAFNEILALPARSFSWAFFVCTNHFELLQLGYWSAKRPAEI